MRTEGSKREIKITRWLDAPSEFVFKAWTDPEYLERWWVPSGFIIKTQEININPGGLWLYVSHGTDGNDHQNRILFKEIIAPEKLVYFHEYNDEDEHIEFEATVAFDNINNRTFLTISMLFNTEDERGRALKEHSVIRRGRDTIERLENELKRMYSIKGSGKEFTISHVFDASKSLVWQAYSEASHLKNWWGPKNFGMEVLKLDFTPGGVFLYEMQSPDGNDMWGKLVYREIIPQEKIVFVVSFTDEEGNIIRHPLSSTWPLEVLNTLIFSEQNGKTTLELHAWPVDALEIEQKTFEEGFKGMQEGVKGTYNELENYLYKVKLEKVA